MWGLLAAIISPNMESRVLAEITPCWDASADGFDITSLCSRPLLTSIYLEALRFCVATSTGRHTNGPNVELGGYKLNQETMLMSISWFGHHDSEFWGTGPNGESVYDFWPERFLKYPQGRSTNEKERTADEDREAKVVTNGIQGHFYPYGGGTKICPGQFFAKQTMMVSVALFVRTFEVELLDVAGAEGAKPDMNYFPVSVQIQFCLISLEVTWAYDSSGRRHAPRYQDPGADPP
jgi:cytochrome P450